MEENASIGQTIGVCEEMSRCRTQGGGVMVAGEGSELKLADVVDQVKGLGVWIIEAAREGTTAHAVEKHLFRGVMGLGLMLLRTFFQMTGSGDLGETFTLPDGRTI